MKYIRDDKLEEVLPILARNSAYGIDLYDNVSRTIIDTNSPNFRIHDYRVVEVRMNDLTLKYQVFVVRKEK